MQKIIVCTTVLLFFIFICSCSAENEAKALLYHQISEQVEDPYNLCELSADAFEQQIKWLYDNGYKSVTISDMFQLIDNGVLPEKVVAITFDDGYPETYSVAYPILSKYGFVATAYVIAIGIDTPDGMTGDQLRELYNNGWEVGSHSMWHIDLTDPNNLEKLNNETCDTRGKISETTGISKENIKAFAYPYGLVNDRVAEKVYKCGFSSGGCLGTLGVSSETGRFCFSRHTIASNIEIEDFVQIFTED